MLNRVLLMLLFVIYAYADYINTTIEDYLQKVGMLNSINIVVDSNISNKKFNFYINNSIDAAHQLNAIKQILHNKHLKLTKKEDVYYVIEEKPNNYVLELNNITSNEAITKLKDINLTDTKFCAAGDNILLVKSYEDIDIVKKLIKKIDKPKKMYLVKVNIYDTDTQFLETLGINLTGNTFKITPGQIELSDNLSFSNYKILMQLLQDKTKSKVLAAPSILLTEKKAAEFTEGYTYAVKSKQILLSTQKDAVGTAEKIDYKKIGLQLKLILIRVTKDGKLVLNVKLTDTNVLNYTQDILNTSTREIKTYIIVKPNERIIMAGLGRETKKERVAGVPILKNLPLLKYIFSRKENKVENRSLVMILEIKEII